MYLIFLSSLCGTSVPSTDFTTSEAHEPDTLLVVFDGTAVTAASGNYEFTVTAEPDACLGDPCHGVPCVDNRDGSNSCIYPGMHFLKSKYI